MRTHQVLDFLSLAFEAEGLSVPPMYSMEALAGATWLRGKALCFEEILTILPHRLNARSSKEWDLVRALVWENAGLDPPAPLSAERLPRVLFLERRHNRNIRNVHELRDAVPRTWEVDIFHQSSLNFRDQSIAPHWADVIVSVFGAQITYVFLSARRGSVMITVYPFLALFNRGPQSVTELAFFSGVRLLDIVLMPEHGMTPMKGISRLEDMNGIGYYKDLRKCAGITYQRALQQELHEDTTYCQWLHMGNDTHVPVGLFLAYLSSAAKLLQVNGAHIFSILFLPVSL